MDSAVCSALSVLMSWSRNNGIPCFKHRVCPHARDLCLAAVDQLATVSSKELVHHRVHPQDAVTGTLCAPEPAVARAPEKGGNVHCLKGRSTAGARLSQRASLYSHLWPVYALEHKRLAAKQGARTTYFAT